MSMAQYGRYGDNQVAHVAKGELVVPKQILRKRPDLRKEIYKEIEKYGVKGKRYVVGNKANSINPYTGQPEFFLKKILPVVTGAIGFAVGGPMGASIGAGLGSAVRGDNPANIATSALMGYGLGSFATSAGLFGTAAPASQFGGTAVPSAVKEAQTVEQLKAALGGDPSSLAKVSAREALGQPSVFQRGAEAFKGMSGLAKGALGLGALGALSTMEEEEKEEVTPLPESPKPGSIAPLDMRAPRVTYYDPRTGGYGAAAPTYRPLAEGGELDTSNFPRRTGQIDGPGTEKSDDIPAMLSDGEFVMTAAAVRGLGALNGADKDDKLEQRRQGAKMMYEMMDKFESKVA
jgi:hypothetical protein